MSGALEPILMRMQDAIRFSGYSRSELYRRLQSGEIEAVKSGGTTLIVVESLRRSVAALPRYRYQPKDKTEAPNADG